MSDNLRDNLRKAGIDPENTKPLLIEKDKDKEVVGKVVVLDPARFGRIRENLLWQVRGVTEEGQYFSERLSDGSLARLLFYDIVAEVKDPTIYSTSKVGLAIY